jgi:hypothetical protein
MPYDRIIDVHVSQIRRTRQTGRRQQFHQDPALAGLCFVADVEAGQ